MLNIILTPETVDRLRVLLDQENDDEAFFRIREAKIGGG